MVITCGGQTVSRPTYVSQRNGFNDLHSRSRILATQCGEGTVQVSCEGGEAKSMSEIFQDTRGAQQYNPSTPVWYHSFTTLMTRNTQNPPFRHTFTISRTDLRERRFVCDYDD